MIMWPAINQPDRQRFFRVKKKKNTQTPPDFIGVLLDILHLAQILQLLDPPVQLKELLGDVLRLALEALLEPGLAVLHQLRVLLKHRLDLLGPGQGRRVQVDVLLKFDQRM